MENTKEKFHIGIPTLNRADLLIPALLFYGKDFPDTKIFVLDNGKQDFSGLSDSKNIEVIQMESNIGVAASWNYLCDKIFEISDNALILNDDIYLGKNKVEILSIINKNKSLKTATPDWCAFIIPKDVFNSIGRFDEVFYPAYYEDRSYEYRMKLQGIKPIRMPELNPFIYRSSQTLQKMPILQEAAKKNKKRYIEMWGGDVGNEKYKFPQK